MQTLLKKIVLVGLLLVAGNTANAQTFSVSGYITDNNSRETLIGATIQLLQTSKVSISDKNGYFSLTGIKTGNYVLLISHVGYESKELNFTIENKGVVLGEINLITLPLKLDEVSIVAVKPDQVADKSIETSHIELTPQMIRSIPTAGNDVFASIKYMPGIDRTEPYSPLYTVRGGDPGENAVLLDGVMIYNPYHSSISSGIFNTMIIKKVDLLIGGFGAEYGGRNSSVMYITSKDGNTSDFHGEFEPSTFHSKLFLEFPAGKNASMMIAGRYLYDLPFNFIFQSQNYFYDFNISYTNRLNSRNRITLKYFESKDFTGYNFNTFYKFIGNSFNTDIYDNFILEQRNDWKNRSATIIHKLILTPRIFVRNQVYYSHHRSNNFSGLNFLFEFPSEENPDDTIRFRWRSSNKLKSSINDLCGKTTFTFKITNLNELHVGAEYNTYKFDNSIDINGLNNGEFRRHPSLIAFFAEDKLSTSFITIRPGVRITNYNNTGWNYEPRLNASINLSKSLRLKAAYGEFLQYIISMNTNEIEMSQIVDYYYPLENLKPSKSLHYIFGVEQRIFSSLTVSLDAYYKQMSHSYAFDMNNFFGFSNKLMKGTGYAYGAELLVEGKIRKISGWLSYSYAKSYRKYPDSEINEGKEYGFDYNRPHTFKSVTNYQITPTFALSGAFTILSGLKRSIETTTQSYFYYDPVANETTFFPMFTTNNKNSAKMPPIINLDLGIRKNLLSGFGKQLADLIHADESYVTITVRNILFLYRNIDMYIPGIGFPGSEDKYFPIGSNYFPQVGISYTLKF